MAIYLKWHIEPGFRLEWFDHQGDPPKTSKEIGAGPLGTVEAVLAHTVEVRKGLHRGAKIIAGRAKSNLSMHRDTGAAYIGSEQHDLDWVVFLGDRDPGGKPASRTGKRSALSIEFGHLYRNKRTGEVQRIGGLFVLTNAANAAAKAPGRRLG